ncbi:MAG: hypothetical protein GY737_18430 [Desulfobacteraceae bacterium]|nr:hypothetical protein [Desulfobacteraceae bacterium]
MKTAQKNNIRDRRGKKDAWTRLLTLFNALSWVVIALILIVTERAKPEFESFFDRVYRLDIRTWWDIEFVRYLFWLAFAGSIMSSIGLMLSVTRARRRDDASRFGLLLMGLFSVLGLGGVVFFLL